MSSTPAGRSSGWSCDLAQDDELYEKGKGDHAPRPTVAPGRRQCAFVGGIGLDGFMESAPLSASHGRFPMLWLLAAGLLLLGPTPDQLQAQERLKEGQRLMSTERFEAGRPGLPRGDRARSPPDHGALRPRARRTWRSRQYPSAVIAFRGAREAFQKRVGGEPGPEDERRRRPRGQDPRPPGQDPREPGARVDRHELRRATDRHATGPAHPAVGDRDPTLQASQFSESKRSRHPRRPVRSPWAAPTSAAASWRMPSGSTARR